MRYAQVPATTLAHAVWTAVYKRPLLVGNPPPSLLLHESTHADVIRGPCTRIM